MMDALSLLTFSLGGRRHAVPMACVQELLYLPLLQPTERVPGHVLGLVTLRGLAVPVLDLATLLGLGTGPVRADQILLLFRSPAGAGPYGLLVDAVDDLVNFEPSDLRPPMNDPDAEPLSPLVAWLGLREERLYHLLDLDLVVSYALSAKGGSRYEALFGGLAPALAEQLQARAERATEVQASEAAGGTACLELHLGGERFALPLKAHLQIAHCPPLFPVPGAPPAILGLTNLGGEPLLVVDLRPLLGMAAGAVLPQSFLLVVEDGAGVLGFYADDVGEVLDLDPGLLQAHPAGDASPLILGEWLDAGRVLHVLDLPLVLAHPGLTLSPAHR